MSETRRRLKEVAECKVGSPPPEWLPINDWGHVMSELAGNALAEIEFYRSVALLWFLLFFVLLIFEVAP